MRTLAYHLANLLAARDNCIRSGNGEWQSRHEARIEDLEALLPSGSGLDLGPRLDIERSRPERLVFSHCDFHHMDENGMYDGWTEHEVIVTPSLVFGIHVRVTGRDRDEIKSYIGELFNEVLTREVA